MRRILLTLAALFAAAAAFAQNSINVQVPNIVAADEQFQLVFSVEGENAPSGIEWEPGSDLQLVWGHHRCGPGGLFYAELFRAAAIQGLRAGLRRSSGRR